MNLIIAFNNQKNNKSNRCLLVKKRCFLSNNICLRLLLNQNESFIGLSSPNIGLLVKKGGFYHLIQNKIPFDSEKRALLVKKRCF